MSEKIQNFIMGNPERALRFMTTFPEKFWNKKGEKAALEAFDQALNSPAYREILNKAGIDPDNIVSVEDLKKLPLTQKDNYFSHSKFTDLYQVDEEDIFGICFTSGTTGNPASSIYSKKSISKAITGILNFLHYYWNIASPKKKTMAMNAFAAGPWTAFFITNSFLVTQGLKYNISLSIPGADPIGVLETIKRVGERYDQIIIGAYPSTIKTIIEEGNKKKIDWSKYYITFVTAGEPLTRGLYDYILDNIDPEKKDGMRILDLYASTEGSASGLSTPLTKAIDKIAREDKKFREEVFGQNELSSIFQYNPMICYLEIVDEKLIITRPGPIPLVRYAIGDFGKIISFEEMEKKLKDMGYDLEELSQSISPGKPLFKWPFFVSMGRSDDMVIAYSGAKIHTRVLLPLLENNKELNSFKITSKMDSSYDNRLVVYLELKEGMKVNSEIEERYEKRIHERLLESSIDYADAYRLSPKKTAPEIGIYSFGEGPFKGDKEAPKQKFKV